MMINLIWRWYFFIDTISTISQSTVVSSPNICDPFLYYIVLFILFITKKSPRGENIIYYPKYHVQQYIERIENQYVGNSNVYDVRSFIMFIEWVQQLSHQVGTRGMGTAAEPPAHCVWA